MEQNYKLEKEYKLTHDTFRDAYREFQKKNVYPKSYLFMALFIVVAVIYVVAAVKDPSSLLSYLLIVVCLALAVREWYNPRKARENLVEAVKALGDVTYKLSVGNDYIDFSTVSISDVEKTEEKKRPADGEIPDDEDEEYELPETTRVPVDSSFSADEYNDFFIMYSGKSIFYVVPKNVFTEYELEIIRELNIHTN